ncbi:MAG TPA: cyclopropane-fatty-acyl-phospholipid synthase family protein [Burkholderiaceae bacterium]|nr:cyclopropane-fatty-acyl-phospholipid synthase family protein [Burkholderiaceae bacterium]HNG79818.1 cyclopropane-fatty-acyl-phospholipid synthase family protein [Burkholderiaceae bacterium]
MPTALRSSELNPLSPSLPALSSLSAIPALGTARPHSRLAGVGARLLQRRLARLLERLACGSLQVQLPDGQLLQAQGAQPGPTATLQLLHWRALGRLVLRGDIGLAEAYRDGDWTTPDLTALLELGARNEAAWQGGSSPARPLRWLFRLAHRRRDNTRRGSRRNISAHYDLGNHFYRQWLDADLIYSSALYRQPGDTLEQAQAAKIARILELLELPQDRDATVLEIGCGWGALAEAIARRGAHLTGLTLSTEQLAHARERLDGAGLASQTDLRLQDYRDVRGSFDRIVSIEMIEAVGERFWPTYFATLHDRLAPGGCAVVQSITIDESAFDSYRREADFIQHFIFPGGMLPSRTVLRQQAEAAGLTIDHVETFGLSYAETLAEWRRRFLAAWPRIARLGFDEGFRRLWEYYLCYCEAGFRCGRVDVGLYRFRRPALP